MVAAGRWRMRLSLAVASISALLTTMTGGPFVPPTALAANDCVNGWQQLPFATNLAAIDAEGVASLNGAPAWIVGLTSAAVPDGDRNPLIGRWTGTTWERVATPWRNYGVLNAVAARSASRAWAVGSIGSYTRWPIAGRWNGSTWTSVAVPHPAGQLGVFTDLALVDGRRLWVAGSTLNNGFAKPLVMFRTRTAWKQLSPTIPALGEGGLSDVTIAPGGKVWAAGWQTDGSGQAKPWILFRQSGNWVTTPLPSLDAGRGAIMDLTFASATNGWAAGWIEEDGAGYEPLLMHWNGSIWTRVSTSWASGRSIGLDAVTAEASGRLVVAGWESALHKRDVLAVLDSSGWTVSSLTDPTDKRSALTDTTAVAGGTLVVGYSDGMPASVESCAAAMARSQAAGPSSATAASDSVANESSGAFEDDQSPATVEDVAAPATVEVADTVAYDMTSQSGLTNSVLTWSGVVADFNGDSYPDVFINRHYEDVPLLELNSGHGTFSLSDTDWTIRDRHSCSAADVNADTKLDLFCTIGRNKGSSIGAQELTLDPADGGTWASLDYGLLDGYGRGRDATFLNLNRDAYPDLFVINEASRFDGMSSSDRLYRNVGGTDFVSASTFGLDHSYGGQCVANADLEHDGDDDLLLCTTERVGGGLPGLHAFVNNGSQFIDQTQSLGLAQDLADDVATADFDGDGALDVAVLSPTQLTVRVRRGGTFQLAYSLDTTGAVALAVGDVNGDGRPDIYVSRRSGGNSGNLMLVNNGTGTAFSSMAIPQPGAGRADDVLAIDYDGNGRTDFVTLNGWGVDGPVKLTAFFRSS
jgi:hypothetical protein